MLGLTYLPYEALSVLYGGFKAPVMKVKINGKYSNPLFDMISSLLNQSSLITDGVKVTLNKDSASSATFHIANSYDLIRRKFSEAVSVGSGISIELGYGSALKQVFKGYVAEISYSYGNTPGIDVTCFDAVKHMQDIGNVERTWEAEQTYGETISEILDKYSSNYSSIFSYNFETIRPLQKHGLLHQKSNDYEYIKKTLCMYCDRDLIVVNGKGALTDPYKIKKVTTLGIGKGLTSFAPDSGYADVKAVVTGDSLLDIKAESSAKQTSIYKLSGNSPQIIKASAPFSSVSECKTYADRLVFEEVRKAQRASGVCIGLPEILPGVGVEIKGIDSGWDKTYYVNRVTHSFSSSGYRTDFETLGWN